LEQGLIERPELAQQLQMLFAVPKHPLLLRNLQL
jgi:hypothetical protein